MAGSNDQKRPFDLKVVRDLTRLMRDHDLIEVCIESPELKVNLRKAGDLAGPTPVVMPLQQTPTAVPVASAPAVPAEAPVDDLADCHQIVSPIPGTVYLKPNPESDPFLVEGARVADGQVVCLVEAMKVFNEIKAEGVQGQVKKICVEDGQAVEYGTVLFLVK